MNRSLILICGDCKKEEDESLFKSDYVNNFLDRFKDDGYYQATTNSSSNATNNTVKNKSNSEDSDDKEDNNDTGQKSTLRSDEPNYIEQIRDYNLLTNIFYNFLNDPWLGFQVINPFVVYPTHLSGEFATKNEYRRGYLNTLTYLGPTGISGGVIRGSVKSTTIFKTLNAAEFSQKFSGTIISRSTPGTRGFINRFYNKSATIINKNANSGGILLQYIKASSREKQNRKN